MPETRCLSNIAMQHYFTSACIPLPSVVCYSIVKVLSICKQSEHSKYYSEYIQDCDIGHVAMDYYRRLEQSLRSGRPVYNIVLFRRKMYWTDLLLLMYLHIFIYC